MTKDDPPFLLRVVGCQLNKKTKFDTGAAADDEPARNHLKSSITLAEPCKANICIYVELKYEQGQLRQETHTTVQTVQSIHSHDPCVIDLDEEMKLQVDMIALIDSLMGANPPNRKIADTLNKFFPNATEAHCQFIWRYIYCTQVTLGYFNEATEIEHAIDNIKQAGGYWQIEWAYDDGAKIPCVLSWVTAPQMELAKMGVCDVLALDTTYSILECGMPIVQVAAKTATHNVLPVM
ncbi:hypothetical protein GGF48_002647, partial [Coemansia sp. RSA 921]